MTLHVDPATIGASAATEEGIGMGIAAATSAAAIALTAVLPMGADADSVAFAAAVNTAGATYLGAVGEHIAGRSGFAGAQHVAAVTYVTTEAMRESALAL